jgi:hypothetical protein
MTRINLVDPSELVGPYLVTEYRELPRVIGLSNAAHARGVDPATFPPTYTMGKGHVTFFYDKVGFLASRFAALVAEMESRGMRPQFRSLPDSTVPESWRRDWSPSDKDIEVNRQRIRESLERMEAKK